MLMCFTQGPKFLVLAACGILAGCAASEYHYKDLFLPLSRMGVSPNRLEVFPVFLVHSDTKVAAPGARLIVDTSPEPTVFESDGAGQVMVPIDSALLWKNPPIRIEPKGVNLVVRISGKQTGRDVRSVQVRAAADLKKIGDSRVAVFHDDGDVALAREVQTELIRARGVIKSFLGLEPMRWAVILETNRKERDVLYLTVPAAGYESCWRCFKEDWESGAFMDINPHEWTESTLTSAFGLYDDPRNRFIGDGLAEFVTWKVHGLPKDYIERLAPAQIGDRETVDLLSEFQVIPWKFTQRSRFGRVPEKVSFSPGYALSFAFWHALYEEHGSALCSTFVEKLARKPSASAEAAIAILVELTGDKTVGDRIRYANVEAARLRIKRLTP